jgi:hypothetical protein
MQVTTKKKNSVALSPRANYTDWATATCRRNLVSTFVDRGVSRGQRGQVTTTEFKSHIFSVSFFLPNIANNRHSIGPLQQAQHKPSERWERERERERDLFQTANGLLRGSSVTTTRQQTNTHITQNNELYGP